MMEQIIIIAIITGTFFSCTSSAPYKDELHKKSAVESHRIFYPPGVTEETLPKCDMLAICNKVDTYGEPYIKRGCKCVGNTECSRSLDTTDGHSLKDQSRILKICEPVDLLPKCRYFRDVSRTYYSYRNNKTVEITSCTCPEESVTYILKRIPFYSEGHLAYKYLFACAPKMKLRCRRKEPCKLFTVKKKERHEEVSTHALCSCPPSLRCPTNHSQPGIIFGKFYKQDSMRTYSGYCN